MALFAYVGAAPKAGAPPYETCQYTEYRLPKMLYSGASVTSFFWPVVRNVSGAPAGLIHDAGSPPAACAGERLSGTFKALARCEQASWQEP